MTLNLAAISQRLRVNHQIRVPEVRVIDDQNSNIGVLSIQEALRRALERGLDLVEVSPNAKPPVCRIADYGKLMYQMEKQERLNRAKQKRTELKGIRLSLNIGEHDANVRRESTLKFLAEGHKVKLEIILRGRERQRADRAREVMQRFIASVDGARVEQPVQMTGNRLSSILGK